MRNFTVFMVGMAAVMNLPVAAADAPSPWDFLIGHRQRIERARARKTSGKSHDDARKAVLNAMEKAATVRTFGWDGMKWMPEDVYSYSYDSGGNVIEELVQDAEGDYSKTVNEYDANGKVAYKETTVSSNGVDFTNNRKIEFSYDPILTDVITWRNEQVWLQQSWKPGNSYKRIISRNDAGNVTSAVIAVLFNGIYDPTQRVSVSYGEDGKATRISEQVLNFDYDTLEYFWEQGVDMTDITWEETDGQIYDTEDLFLGNNRLKSAHYSEVNAMSMDVSVEYADDSDAYSITMEGVLEDGFVTTVVSYTPLDNDGYILTATTRVMDEEVWSRHEEYRYDEWGLLTYSARLETDEGVTYGQSSVGEVVYDEEGRPATYTVSEIYVDPETGDESKDYVIRAEYSDYVDVTTDVQSLRPYGADERYFDLNGMRVAMPEKGRIVVTEKGKKRKW